MRGGQTLDLRSRLVAALLTLALLVAGRGGAEESGSTPDPLKDAVGILLDNQDRCLSLAYGKHDLLESGYGPGEQRAAIEHYVLRENRTRVQVAKNALALAQSLTSKRNPGTGTADVSGPVSTMRREQERICDWATSTSGAGSASKHRQQIDQHSRNFERALSALPHFLQLSSSQRLAVAERYHERLYGVDGDFSDEAIARAIEEDRDLPSGAQISQEDYQRKKEAYDEWLADQERREAARIRLQAQRRAQAAERQKQEPREMPKLELRVPEESESAVGLAAGSDEMAKWHADYRVKVSPFKQSLANFLKVQSTSRNLIMLQACQDLSRIAKGVLEDATALESPDPAIGKELRDALTWFKRAADSCIGNRLQRTRQQISEGERSLAQAMTALKPYELGL